MITIEVMTCCAMASTVGEIDYSTDGGLGFYNDVFSTDNGVYQQ
jgi:hypothetical protein